MKLPVFFLFLLLPAVSLATDGVLEINQTCATSQAGCFAGDTGGFPVTIGGSAGRSYRLTSELNTGGATTVGIQISATRTTIDLNGFGINGFAIGSKNDSGHGISGAASASFATIKNGSLRGHRGWGIALGDAEGVKIQDLVVEFNANGGVQVGDNAHVVGNRIASNGSATDDGEILNDHGVITGSGALVSDNTVSDSGAQGIRCALAGVGGTFGGCVISNNAVNTSGSSGITANSSLVSGNSVRLAGGSGISAFGGTVARDNHVSSCDSFGLSGDVSFSYGENTFRGNASGGVFGVGPSANLGGNYCLGPGVTAPSCP